MKNELPVVEVLELKDSLEMKDIMKLQDGITKEEAVDIIEDKASVDDIVASKESPNDITKLEGIRIESERFPNFAKEGSHDMNILNINQGNGMKFSEVSNLQNKEVLESVMNTESKKTDKRKKLQMKMRPMRVKVRKPFEVNQEEEESIVENISPMDESFGLKQTNANDDLVLSPTPAVPGKPVILFISQISKNVLSMSFKRFFLIHQVGQSLSLKSFFLQQQRQQ